MMKNENKQKKKVTHLHGVWRPSLVARNVVNGIQTVPLPISLAMAGWWVAALMMAA
jgi:hypothetical protein